MSKLKPLLTSLVTPELQSTVDSQCCLDSQALKSHCAQALLLVRNTQAILMNSHRSSFFGCQLVLVMPIFGTLLEFLHQQSFPSDAAVSPTLILDSCAGSPCLPLWEASASVLTSSLTWIIFTDQNTLADWHTHSKFLVQVSLAVFLSCMSASLQIAMPVSGSTCGAVLKVLGVSISASWMILWQPDSFFCKTLSNFLRVNGTHHLKDRSFNQLICHCMLSQFHWIRFLETLQLTPQSALIFQPDAHLSSSCGLLGISMPQYDMIRLVDYFNARH